MTSPKPASKFPIVAIPKEVFDILERRTDVHLRPTVNSVVQQILGDRERYWFEYLLSDYNDGILFEDAELRRIRLTKRQYGVLQSLQRQFSSQQRFYDAAKVLTSMLCQCDSALRDELRQGRDLVAEGFSQGEWGPVSLSWIEPDGSLGVSETDEADLVATSVLL